MVPCPKLIFFLFINENMLDYSFELHHQNDSYEYSQQIFMQKLLTLVMLNKLRPHTHF